MTSANASDDCLRPASLEVHILTLLDSSDHLLESVSHVLGSLDALIAGYIHEVPSVDSQYPSRKDILDHEANSHRLFEVLSQLFNSVGFG